MHRTGITEKIRNAARSLKRRGYFSRRDVYLSAGLARGDGEPFKRAWNILRRRGELIMLGKNMYRYHHDCRPRGKKRVSIYRAMHIKGAFCASDISMLSDAKLSYVRNVINDLLASDELELTGKKGNVMYFRVRHTDNFYLDNVQ